MLYTTLGLLCKKQARIISLSSDDNSSGKLEAVDQMKFGLSLIWLALESNSLELPCQCKLGKVQDFSDYSGVHQEAGWPPARARLWAIGHTCVLSVRYPASHPLCTQSLPWRKKLAAELRSCTDREFGEYLEIFRHVFLTWEAV